MNDAPSRRACCEPAFERGGRIDLFSQLDPGRRYLSGSTASPADVTVEGVTVFSPCHPRASPNTNIASQLGQASTGLISATMKARNASTTDVTCLRFGQTLPHLGNDLRC